MDYFQILHRDFAKESDRAAVILAASAVEELLRTILIARLVAVTSSSDELFDSATAPLGTLSSRIEMAYRLGVISVKFARDLHLLRKIRNDFAHNINGCSFDDARVKSRILELTSSHGIISRSRHVFPKDPPPREAFLQTASWMVFHLTAEAKGTVSLSPAPEEWGYSYVYPKDDRSNVALVGSSGNVAAQQAVAADDPAAGTP